MKTKQQVQEDRQMRTQLQNQLDREELEKQTVEKICKKMFDNSLTYVRRDYWKAFQKLTGMKSFYYSNEQYTNLIRNDFEDGFHVVLGGGYLEPEEPRDSEARMFGKDFQRVFKKILRNLVIYGNTGDHYQWAKYARKFYDDLYITF